ncbi:MAG: transcription-repair coupling factor [Thermoanaerobaculia bacterium]
MLENLLEKLLKIEEIRKGNNFSSILPSLSGIIIYLKHKILKENFLILVSSEEEAEKIKSGIEIFSEKEKVLYIPSLPLNPYEFLPQPLNTRINIMKSFFLFQSAKTPFLILRASFLPFPFPKVKSLKLKVGEGLSWENILKTLEDMAYTRVPQVQEIGEYAVRGNLIDFFSPLYEKPIRMEIELERINSLRYFDEQSQKSIEKTMEAEIIPLNFNSKELIIERKKFFEEKVTGLGGRRLLENPNFPIIFSIFTLNKEKRKGNFHISTYGLKYILKEWEDTFQDLIEAAQESKKTGFFDLPPEEYFFQKDEKEFLPDFKFEPLSFSENSSLPLKTRGLGIIPQDLKTFSFEYLQLIKEKFEVYLFLSHPSHERILKRYLEEQRLSFPYFYQGNLKENIVLEELKIALLSSSRILGEPPAKYKIQIPKDFSYIDEAYKKGERVVHMDYGIGIYEGLHSIEGGEFIKIKYSDGDLYLPVEKLYLLSPYPKLDNPPPLDFLGNKNFLRKKRKIQKTLKSMVLELLNLYASRKVSKGISHQVDGLLLKKIEDTFPYEETEDQLKVWEEVKMDMEDSSPMDRLVSGDVGFGKTEIAIRASVKAVESGFQVAILCPTTLLAFQHYRTFKERLADTPINLAWISRFINRKEQKEILERTKTGEIDILIGTHRLLSRDVEFKKLGLLIIDEEQRFGVAHKERLRVIKKNVDTLTLTATPIPRTFNLAMLGLKSISLIGTPPPGRYPVDTSIIPFNLRFIKDAINYEINRGGQVFFVHNRVESLPQISELLQNLVPNFRFVITHGQMNEKELEKNMLKFVRGEVEGLLTTTIIENGIDIPRANTLIINNAQNFGLAQLYQLRGRVGRSDRQAFCYLLIPQEEKLSPSALNRLKVLEEFTALGSGFKVAARDFEMRGAGEILGKAQSGHLETLGYDLYMRLLDKTIKELKGIEEEEIEEISLKVRYEIPKSYIEEETLRLKAYRMLLEKDPEELYGTFKDLFGPPPEEVKLLIEIARIRQRMKKLRIQKIEKQKDKIIFKFSKNTPVPFDKILKFVNEQGGRFTPEGLVIIPSLKEGKNLILFLREILESLK